MEKSLSRFVDILYNFEIAIFYLAEITWKKYRARNLHGRIKVQNNFRWGKNNGNNKNDQNRITAHRRVCDGSEPDDRECPEHFLDAGRR